MPYIIAGVAVVILLLLCLKVVPQATQFVIERLGKYQKTWDAGLHLLIPIIDRIAKKVTLKEQVLDSPPQPVNNTLFIVEILSLIRSFKVVIIILEMII